MFYSKKAILAALVFIFLSINAQASVGDNSWSFDKGRDYTKTDSLNIETMRAIVFSKKYNFEKRWQTVSKLSSLLEKRERLLFLVDCLKSKDWFLQSPALKILKIESPRMAIGWARKLLKEDRALVVRSEAVSVIDDLRDEGATALLWDELYSAKNFKGSASLWIRPQIVKALRKLEKFPKKDQWRSLLKDSDEKIQREARVHIKNTKF